MLLFINQFADCLLLLSVADLQRQEVSRTERKVS